MTRRLLRTAAAVAMSLSWLVAAGLPASAAVTDIRVDSPKANDAIRKAEPLIVIVEWTDTPGVDDVGVRTRLVDSQNRVVGCPAEPDPQTECGVLLLNEAKPDNNATESPGDERRFKGEIDPHRNAWFGGAVAPNGAYQLHYQWVEYTEDGPDEDDRPDPVNSGNWQSHPFVLDAPPPPQGTPVARMTHARNREVTVAWPANPAPDLTSYQLERRATGGEWTVAQPDIPPGQTQTFDRVPSKGDYRYRVVAARQAGKPDDPPRTTVSMPSTTVQVATLREKYGAPPESLGDNAQFEDPVIGSGQPSTGSTPGPQFAAPDDANQTYKGPLDYGVEPREVTERVPIDVAEGDSGGDSALEVIDNAIDQERVLPPLAGGLILIVSAAHVLRYLNE